MQTKIPMTFTVKSKYFDGDTGEMFDEMTSVCKGCMLLRDGTTRLLYREKTEEADITTEMSFSERNTITLKKSGSARYELVFSEGQTYKFVYYAPPLSFDAEVTTHKIKNSMCMAGGNITIEYSMDMGGHKQRVTVSTDAGVDVK